MTIPKTLCTFRTFERLRLPALRPEHYQSFRTTTVSLGSSVPSSSSASSSSVPFPPSTTLLQPNHRIHLVFGANTDVGKTIITTGLVRASLLRRCHQQHHQDQQHQHEVNYIKPLQCGSLDTGGDQGFVEKYVANLSNRPQCTFTAHTLFRWSTAASPHMACHVEQRPVSDAQVLQKLHATLSQLLIPPTSDQAAVSTDPAKASTTATTSTATYIETAGGVLSPSSSSPENHHPQRHVLRNQPNLTTTTKSVSTPSQDPWRNWGWTLQGDLYRQSSMLSSHLTTTSVILIGDGRLGGISATICAMESLLIRGYDIVAILFLEPALPISSASTNSTVSDDHNEEHMRHSYTEGANVQAIRDYVASRQLRSGNGELLFPFPKQSIVSLPPIPMNPSIPLYDWYESPVVTSMFQNVEQYMSNSWEDTIYDMRSTVRTVHSDTSPIWIPGSSDEYCRRLFVHSSANDNSDGSTASTIQVIQSPPKSVNENSNISTSTNDYPSIPIGTASRPSNATELLECKSIKDASGSWWTQSGILSTNNNTSMVLAMAATASRYGGHISGTPPASCMIHSPLLLLSQTLQRYHKKWASHVYFTDDGGTSAVEVAIKMGFKTYQQRMKLSQKEIEQTHWIVAAQDSCYHGDTLGALNIMESYVSTEHPWYQERSFCLSTPSIGYQQGILSINLPDGMTVPDDTKCKFDSIHDVMDIHVRSMSPKLLSLYKEMIEMQWLAHEHRTLQKIGCVILEPLLQCAGGMKFVDPLWQSAMIDVAQSRSIPVVLDESSTGLYRLGIRSCSQILLRDPDIIIYSKLLTGGVLPMSAVITNKNVYEACYDNEFLYGNTFVANPIACASALYALSMYDAYQKQQETENPSTIKYSTRPYLLFDEERIKQISLLSSVRQCATLGSVLTIALHESNDKSDSANAPRLVRTLLDRQSILIGLNQVSHSGDVVYIMVPPFTGTDECDRIIDVLYKAIQEL